MKNLICLFVLLFSLNVSAQVRQGDQVWYGLNLVNHNYTGSLYEKVKALASNQALVYSKQVFGQDVQETEEWRKLEDFLTSDEVDYILKNCVTKYGGTLEAYNVAGVGSFPSCHLKDLNRADFLGFFPVEAQKASDAWIGHVPVTSIFEAHYITQYGPLIMKAQNFLFGSR